MGSALDGLLIDGFLIQNAALLAEKGSFWAKNRAKNEVFCY
jgi:hypothetical protein